MHEDSYHYPISSLAIIQESSVDIHLPASVFLPWYTFYLQMRYQHIVSDFEKTMFFYN